MNDYIEGSFICKKGFKVGNIEFKVGKLYLYPNIIKEEGYNLSISYVKDGDFVFEQFDDSNKDFEWNYHFYNIVETKAILRQRKIKDILEDG